VAKIANKVANPVSKADSLDNEVCSLVKMEVSLVKTPINLDKMMETPLLLFLKLIKQ